MKQFLMVTAVLFALCNPAGLWASPILTEGHYESSGLYCAYNVSFDGTDYVAEGDHSSSLRCRDAGTVLIFESDGEGRYVKNFGTVLYEWTILSETSFLERIKSFRNGAWTETNKILFRRISAE